jgi:medium-chain acyl-[acyl-carrier-protein] hydrolase
MTTARTSRWVVRPRPNPQAKLRLFCLPYAGGSATIYHPWPNDLPPAVEVNAVQLPGRGSRMDEPSFTRMEPLVEATVEALRPHLDRPFAIFGHSMGALLGFEVARHLRRAHNVEPLHLFVSGHSAPHCLEHDAPIHALPKKEFLEELRRYGGMSDETFIDEELMNIMIPILRADLEVFETYTLKTEPPLGSPISAFGGLEDHRVSRESLEGWRAYTAAKFSVRMFSGGHFFLQSKGEALLAAVSRDLHHHCAEVAGN